jgi:hypothetical protein
MIIKQSSWIPGPHVSALLKMSSPEDGGNTHFTETLL